MRLISHNDIKDIGKSQRIASNTIVLFIRMFVLTIVNLYAVRLTLNGLGAEDYGIFNAVAGVITMSSFVSGVMELSIQRFYSYSIGEQDEKKLQEIFSISVMIIFFLAIIVLISFETIGLWFLNTQLNIPASRMDAAFWCFHFSLFAFIFSIIQIPFSAAVFSHEDMDVYAIISTIDCILRLLVAFFIGKTIIDNLSFYSGGLVIVAIIVFLMYMFVGYLRYPECQFKNIKNKLLAKSLLSFSGWTLFGSISKVGMIQGSTILLNIFFGPIANVAFAICLQINVAFNALCNSMVLALRPAMIKAYAEKEFEYLNQLFSVSNKFILYILLALALPMIFEMKDILLIWLGDKVTEQIVLFAQLIIIYVICLAMSNPITIIMQATGHIKEYFLPVESVSLMCLPISWLLFHIGLPSYSIFISMIGVCVISHIIRIYCLRKFYSPFSTRDYLVQLCLPATFIFIIGATVTFVIHTDISNNILRLLINVTFTPLSVALMAYYMGITRKEKTLLKKLLRSSVIGRLWKR